MSQEHQPEHLRGPEHSSAELEAAARERMDQLRHHENKEADNPDRRAEAAREVIHRQEQAPRPEQPPAAETHKPHHRLLNPHLNYAHTLTSLQHRLKPAARTFSKVIHAPIVERTSDALENTVARPSVAAGAGWTAFIVGAIFYFTARHYGWALSGSEMILSFIVGGLLGLLIEFIWRSLFRRHPRS
jgi:hypothetical protein